MSKQTPKGQIEISQAKRLRKGFLGKFARSPREGSRHDARNTRRNKTCSFMKQCVVRTAEMYTRHCEEGEGSRN